MAQKVGDITRPGPALDAATAQKVFGWKNVHKHEGVLIGKKQDRAGRWRRVLRANEAGSTSSNGIIEEKPPIIACSDHGDISAPAENSARVLRHSPRSGEERKVCKAPCFRDF